LEAEINQLIYTRMRPTFLLNESNNMRTKAILIPMVLLVTLGMVLTACGSKARSTATQPPVVQSTATKPPVIQSTATQPPTIQPTATQPPVVQSTATKPPVIQSTATQPPVVQPSATQPPAVNATNTPAAGGSDGQVLLNDRCTVCHNLNRVTSLKNTADQWDQIVSRMVQNGAQLTAAEQKVLVDYLAKTYGP
jgi:cytochrome c5